MAVVPKPEALNCPKCGASLQLRGFANTLTIVCPSCLSVLDAKDPRLQILQKYHKQERVQPIIPIGKRGKFFNVPWECIGFQVRTVEYEGEQFSWHEYLLFNPYKGFRYLTFYNGHWNFVRSLQSVPSPVRGMRPSVTYQGQGFRHFTTGIAETTYILGEFPWQVRRGEKVTTMDFIAPPRMLSSETTESETTWSLGEYMEPSVIWSGMGMTGTPPQKVGIFSDQPAPAGTDLRGMWLICLALIAILMIMAIGMSVTARRQEVFERSYVLNTQPYVTDTFQLKGHNSTVEVATKTEPDVRAFLNFALINSDTGTAYDFGRELEGGHDTAIVPSVPAGNYYLRVEPEIDGTYSQGKNYEIHVRRDVPSTSFAWIAAFLLLIPPAFKSLGAGSFEAQRWKESDYAA